MPTKTYDMERLKNGPGVPEYLREFAQELEKATNAPVFSASSISSEST